MQIGVVGPRRQHRVGLCLGIVDSAPRKEKIGQRDARGEVRRIQIHGVLNLGIGRAEAAHMQIRLP